MDYHFKYKLLRNRTDKGSTRAWNPVPQPTRRASPTETGDRLIVLMDEFKPPSNFSPSLPGFRSPSRISDSVQSLLFSIRHFPRAHFHVYFVLKICCIANLKMNRLLHDPHVHCKCFISEYTRVSSTVK